MTNPEQPQQPEQTGPDFSNALKIYRRILTTDLFLFGGDRDAVGQAGLMLARERDEVMRAAAARKCREFVDFGKTVETNDLSEPPVARLISETEES